MLWKNFCTLACATLIFAGCETTEPVAQSGQTDRLVQTGGGIQVIGDARMASFVAPKDCERMSLGTTREGRSRRVQSGCAIRSGDAMVIIGLSEMNLFTDDLFEISGGGSSDFDGLASAFPREMLGEHLLTSEKMALAMDEPGWRKTNKRHSLLPGNGGVEGAVACVRFSFDAATTAGAPRRNRTEGVRCSRFGKSSGTVEDVMIEVMSIYPSESKAPANYRQIVGTVIPSLRYR